MAQTSKPTKPWYRARNITLAVSAVVVGIACWAGYWVWWAYNARPTVTVDYTEKLVELSASFQPEGENAWPLLMQVAADMQDVEREVNAMEFEPRVDDVGDMSELAFSTVFWPEFYPDNIERERMALQLLEARGTFDLLKRAATMPCSVTPMYKEKRLFGMEHAVTGDPLEGVVEVRWILKLLYARMRIASDAKDFDTLVEVFHQAMMISAFLSYQPVSISRQVAIAVENGALQHLEQILNETDLPADVSTQLQDALAAHTRSAPLELNVEGLRYRLLDVIQRVYTDDGRGGGRYLLSAVQELLNEDAKATQRAFQGVRFEVDGLPETQPVRRRDNLATYRFADRAETVAKLDEVLEAMKVVLDDAALDLESKLAELDAIVAAVPEKHAVLAGNLGSIGSLLASLAYTEQRMVALQILLAIEWYQSRYGDPPSSLDALMPGIIAALPLDPKSGHAFLYRRLDTPDELGREFLLYLPGAGGIDNGGKALHWRDGSVTDVMTDPYVGSEYDVIMNDDFYDRS